MKTGELVFVGFGLGENGITLKGLEAVRDADEVYVETYTNYTPEHVLRRLERISGRAFRNVSREDLENLGGKLILDKATESTIVLLTPGDPFTATTHIALRLEAEKRGIKTRVVGSSSVVTSAAGACGLQIYKFGESATICFPDGGMVSTKPYEATFYNLTRRLHTLLLLDYRIYENKAMTINEGLKLLREVEDIKQMGVFTEDRLVVGLARLGYDNSKVKGGRLDELIYEDFGEPPHCIIVPGMLHFLEAEALIKLANVRRSLVENIPRFRGFIEVDTLDKYILGVKNVFREMKTLGETREMSIEKLNLALEWARNYYDDSIAFKHKGDLVSSLIAIAYCEGILEGLRLLKLVDFKWEGEH
ncbi:diphthine synthase [Candidatus Bathyarchaeota archaeon]|nr:diphthine synthase [Candidatus Bathyarchaeota archaeon]MBS7612883.1 diphthine synthase [Candidatus Bathyarchaeota archaeon]MBS7617173.1 diphthine synthase [Candidatus Bathyarchaeota archaeon]